MATNGMTINGLNPLSALTADDKIPAWDTGASGEPTKEITAQNMANSVKSLASLPNTTEMNTAIEQSTADVIRTGDVVNSLTSTSITAPLSANMGNHIKLTLGKIETGDKNTSTVSVPTSTPTLCSSISLAAGTWIVVACADWQANADGYRQITFASGINPGRNMASTIQGISGKEAYQQVVRIIYTEGETLNVYALQNSGNTINVYPYLYAVRISV